MLRFLLMTWEEGHRHYSIGTVEEIRGVTKYEYDRRNLRIITEYFYHALTRIDVVTSKKYGIPLGHTTSL
jgi:hypothetical protein